MLRRAEGYWPTPAIADAEAFAWVSELTDPDLDIAPEEAKAVLVRLSRSGEVHRPRIGQVVAAVLVERRRRAGAQLALLRAPHEDEDYAATAARFLPGIRQRLPGAPTSDADTDRQALGEEPEASSRLWPARAVVHFPACSGGVSTVVRRCCPSAGRS
jgi:hypothetical protein